MSLPRTTVDMMCDPDCRSGSEGESFTCVNKQKYQTLSSVLLRRFIEERWFLKKIIRFARANRVKCFKKRIPSLYMWSCEEKAIFKTLISFFARANELNVLKSAFLRYICEDVRKGDFKTFISLFFARANELNVLKKRISSLCEERQQYFFLEFYFFFTTHIWK